MKSKKYKIINKKTMAEEIIKEVREILEGESGPDELTEFKKLIVDKKTGQVSLRIPKSLASKVELDEKSECVMVFNLKKKETLEAIGKSKFVVYLKEKPK